MSSLDQACQVAAEHFGWDPLDVSAIHHGHIHESFFVASSAGHFVLQRVNQTVFSDMESVMSNTLTLCRHVRPELVPRPAKTRQGDWLAHDDGDVWRAFEQVAGATPVGAADPSQADQAGALLGAFHRQLADLDPAKMLVTLPNFHHVAKRLEDFRDMIRRDPLDRLGTARCEVDTALEAEPLAVTAEHLIRELPQRVAHNDAKLDNILFRDRVAVCIVDLDTVMPGPWFFDVGDLLRTASTVSDEDEPNVQTVTVDPELYRSVMRGYRRGVADAATPEELAALANAGPLVTYEQALRFLTDWLAGDVYYRTSRPNHNLERARVQLKLLATMPGASSTQSGASSTQSGASSTMR